MADTYTTTKDGFIPEVWADMINAEFLRRSIFVNSPVVTVDDSLAGKPGDTIYFPKWGKISGMQEIQEGQAPEIRNITQTRTAATVKEVGNAFGWTDERELVTMGDAQTEGARQMGILYAEKVDDDLISAALLKTKANAVQKLEKSEPLEYAAKETVFSWGMFVDAVASLGDQWNPAEYAGLWIRSDAQAALMKDEQFINAARLGTQTPLQTGQIGQIGGVPVMVSNALPERTAILAKPNSLGLFYKRRPQVEPERKPGYRQNVLWMHAFYAAARIQDRGILSITHAAPTV